MRTRDVFGQIFSSADMHFFVRSMERAHNIDIQMDDQGDALQLLITDMETKSSRLRFLTREYLNSQKFPTDKVVISIKEMVKELKG